MTLGPLPTSALRRQKVLFSLTGAALVLGILAVINFIFAYVPFRWDSSEGQVYSISKGTKQVLKGLDDPLIIRVIFTGELPPPFNLNQRYVNDLLSEYKRAAHGKIRLEYLNPAKNNDTRQEAIQSGVMPVQLDSRERDRREVKECFMGIAFIYGDQKDAIAVIQDTGSLEYEITSRIKKLISPVKLKVGFVTNGSALTLESANLEPLSQPVNKLYDVTTVDMSSGPPAGLKVLWLVGPAKTLEPKAVDNLRQWVRDGNTLGLLIDRYDMKLEEFRAAPFRSGLEDLLKEWGLDFRGALVVDPQSDRIQIRSTQGYFQMINVIDYPYFPLVTDLNRANPATKDIDRVSFPFVSPFITEKEAPGLVYTPMARTSKMSWLDSNPYNLTPMQRKSRPADAVEGPFNVGLVVEGNFNPDPNAAPKKGRVILFGCSRFIRSEYPSQNSNYNLFLNILDWSAQDEVLLSIRSKGASFRPLKNVSDAVRSLLKFAMVFFLPIFSLLIGLAVYLKQKARRALVQLQYRIS